MGSKNNNFKKTFAITCVALAGSVATLGAVSKGANDMQLLDTKTAIENGVDVDVSNESLEKLWDLSDKLQKDPSQITMGETMKMTEETYDLTCSIFQEKLSKMFIDSEEKIIFDIEQHDVPIDKTYFIKYKRNSYKYNTFPGVFSNTMPEEVAKAIDYIEASKKLKQGNSNKYETISELRDTINWFDGFAGGYEFYLKDGEVCAKVITKSEIETKEKSQKDLTDEER